MVTDAMIEAGRAAWQSAIKDRNLDHWLAHMYTAMHAARPTADLGEDGELVERLYELGSWLRGVDEQTAADNADEAADRLILYREALEAAYREGWIDGYHNGRGCSVIDPGPDWLESDARAVLFRSGG